MWLLSIPFYFFFAISSQVTKASSEVCSSTTLPNPMESLERNTPHYKLPPTCWRPTPLCKTPLKRWNTLFGRGIGGGHVRHYYPWWIRGLSVNYPSNLKRQPSGDSFCFWYRETKLLNFLDMLGGVGAFVRWKPLFQLLGGKTQIHTGAKSQSWTVLCPKIPDKLHPLPHSFKPKPHHLPLKKARPAI